MIIMPEANETLLVTIQDEPSTTLTYLVSDTNNRASINVEDDDSAVPVLFIEASADGFAENADLAEFTVSAYNDQAKTNSINPRRAIYSDVHTY